MRRGAGRPGARQEGVRGFRGHHVGQLRRLLRRLPGRGARVGRRAPGGRHRGRHEQALLVRRRLRAARRDVRGLGGRRHAERQRRQGHAAARARDALQLPDPAGRDRREVRGVRAERLLEERPQPLQDRGLQRAGRHLLRLVVFGEGRPQHGVPQLAPRAVDPEHRRTPAAARRLDRRLGVLEQVVRRPDGGERGGRGRDRLPEHGDAVSVRPLPGGPLLPSQEPRAEERPEADRERRVCEIRLRPAHGRRRHLRPRAAGRRVREALRGDVGRPGRGRPLGAHAPRQQRQRHPRLVGGRGEGRIRRGGRLRLGLHRHLRRSRDDGARSLSARPREGHDPDRIVRRRGGRHVRGQREDGQVAELVRQPRGPDGRRRGRRRRRRALELRRVRDFGGLHGLRHPAGSAFRQHRRRHARLLAHRDDRRQAPLSRRALHRPRPRGQRLGGFLRLVLREQRDLGRLLRFRRRRLEQLVGGRGLHRSVPRGEAFARLVRGQRGPEPAGASGSDRADEGLLQRRERCVQRQDRRQGVAWFRACRPAGRLVDGRRAEQPVRVLFALPRRQSQQGSALQPRSRHGG